MKNFESLPLADKLLKKIYSYAQTIWKEKWKDGTEKDWLENFQNADVDVLYNERINMLYLLSKFMYFGNAELRQLLFSLYRDLFKYPVIAAIRKRNGDTVDLNIINAAFEKELNATRFLGVGNPSESGVHMLYYFRQECKLSKDYFINSNDVFSTTQKSERLPDGRSRDYLETEMKDMAITRYIFIDDFCGSGSQAKLYLKEQVENMRFKNPNIEVHYLMLFGTEFGITQVKGLNIFDRVEAVYSINETFKAFSDDSRYFISTPDPIIEKVFSNATALKYGRNLFTHPLGYKDGQLLLGLFHNTPDNSLPIFWSDAANWKPVFRRYNKIY